MRMILTKFTERGATHEEVTTILQLLINYAMTEAGAMHLNELKVLDTLFKANIMQVLNE